MSQFLPDGFGQTPPSGVADITPPDPETTSADIALMQRVLSAASRNPNLIPEDFMSYVLDWIQTQPDLDASRVMVTGGSYGGFMTLAVATNYNDRICCSVDVVGPSNLATFL